MHAALLDPFAIITTMHDIAIIGGGASGLICAVAACEATVRAGAALPRILILEATDKVGRSILRSGNGRCNFSNAHIQAHAYNDPDGFQMVSKALEQQTASSPSSVNPVVGFFERLGLLWREESEGRLYPQANKASVVLEVLRAPLQRFGVEMRVSSAVQRIVPPKAERSHFTIHLASGELIRARTAVVAAGGAAGAFGLEGLLPYEPPKPILGPLATETRFTRALDNIRVRCSASLLREGERVAEERGEVLFRKYGVSGICIFNLSRSAQAGDVIRLDLLPEVADPGALMASRLTDLARMLAKTPSNFELLQGAVLPLVADQVLKSLGLEGAQEANAESARRIAQRLAAFDLPVQGIGDESVCQVHRGGFALDAFCPETLEAKEVPGLHVLGEALDMDGACGGFNLHWAFMTGLLAGWSLA